MKNQVSKVYSIELYRFIIIMTIAVMHFREDYILKGFDKFPNIFQGGYLGVDFFFILTGFFLYKSYCKLSSTEGKTNLRLAVNYTCNKFKRLYPEYLIAIILMILVKIFVSGNVIYQLKSAIFARKYQFIFLHGINIPHTGGEMRSIWYLSPMIILSYIIMYLLLKNKDLYLGIFATFLNLFVLIFLMNIKGSLSLHTGPIVGFITGGLFRGFLGMNIGIICSVISNELQKYKPHRPMLAVFNIMEIASFIVIYRELTSPASLGDFNVLYAFSIIIICSYLNCTLVSKLLNRKIFLKLGKISYGIYLNHLIVSYLLCYIIPNKTWWKVTMLFVAGTLILTVITSNVSTWLTKKASRIKWVSAD